MGNDKKKFPWQKTDNGIKKVLTALSDDIQTEEEDRYGGIARAIAKEYDRDERDMDPDTFAALISYDIVEKLHNQLTRQFFPQYTQNRKLLFAVQRYRFFKCHIEDMIAEKSCCPADVSRWLIKQYITYLEDPSKLPDMTQTTPDGRTCLWKPSFGTAGEWMAYCAALEELYYGHSESFFFARGKLLLARMHDACPKQNPGHPQ